MRGVARTLVAARIDGVIATNTTLARDAVRGLPHADEAGGLSGAPVREASNRVIRTLADALDGALPIIGVGGILSGDDAREKIAAGATLVQLYTGLIYRGPGARRRVRPRARARTRRAAARPRRATRILPSASATTTPSWLVADAAQHDDAARLLRLVERAR